MGWLKAIFSNPMADFLKHDRDLDARMAQIRDAGNMDEVDLQDQDGYMTVCDGCRDEGWWDSQG